MSEIRRPLALSLAAHAVGLTAIFLLPAAVPSAPTPIPTNGIDVAFVTSLPAAEPAPSLEPPQKAETQPPPPLEPEQAPLEPSELVAAPESPAPAPQEPAPVSETPPPPPRKPLPKPVFRHPETPRPSPVLAPAQPTPAAIAAPQTASLPPQPASAPSHDIPPGYRSQLGAWLESHKHYPDAARQRSEEGHAVLRFVVDRGGRVIDFAVIKSSGHPDLDSAIEEMMRGAALPPFPMNMTQAQIEVSVTIRFSLTR